MAAFYQFGQDKNYPPLNFAYTTNTDTIGGQVVNQHVNVQGDHKDLIRRIGSASTVMLKNANKGVQNITLVSISELDKSMKRYR